SRDWSSDVCSSDLNAQVRGNVFEWNELFQLRILLLKVFIALFCRKRKRLNDAVLVSYQRILKHDAEEPFKYRVAFHQLFQPYFWQQKNFAVGQGTGRINGRLVLGKAV